MELVGSDLLEAQLVGRGTEMTAKLCDCVDVGLLGRRREIADRRAALVCGKWPPAASGCRAQAKDGVPYVFVPAMKIGCCFLTGCIPAVHPAENSGWQLRSKNIFMLRARNAATQRLPLI